MTIRLATAADALDIHNLHTRSVRGLCSKDYPPELIDAWLRGRSPEGYKGIAKGEMYVYEKDNVIAGWSHAKPDNFALFVDPEYSRLGIGSELFKHTMEIIRSHTDQPIEFDATLTAVPFYEKMGCKVISRSEVTKNSTSVETVRMLTPQLED